MKKYLILLLILQIGHTKEFSKAEIRAIVELTAESVSNSMAEQYNTYIKQHNHKLLELNRRNQSNFAKYANEVTNNMAIREQKYAFQIMALKQKHRKLLIWNRVGFLSLGIGSKFLYDFGRDNISITPINIAF